MKRFFCRRYSNIEIFEYTFWILFVGFIPVFFLYAIYPLSGIFLSIAIVLFIYFLYQSKRVIVLTEDSLLYKSHKYSIAQIFSLNLNYHETYYGAKVYHLGLQFKNEDNGFLFSITSERNAKMFLLELADALQCDAFDCRYGNNIIAINRLYKHVPKEVKISNHHTDYEFIFPCTSLAVFKCLFSLIIHLGTPFFTFLIVRQSGFFDDYISLCFLLLSLYYFIPSWYHKRFTNQLSAKIKLSNDRLILKKYFLKILVYKKSIPLNTIFLIVNTVHSAKVEKMSTSLKESGIVIVTKQKYLQFGGACNHEVFEQSFKKLELALSDDLEFI